MSSRMASSCCLVNFGLGTLPRPNVVEVSVIKVITPLFYRRALCRLFAVQHLLDALTLNPLFFFEHVSRLRQYRLRVASPQCATYDNRPERGGRDESQKRPCLVLTSRLTNPPTTIVVRRERAS